MTVRNLIVTRAGARTRHAGWVSGPSEAEFHLLVTAYDASILEEDSANVRFVHLPGTKVAGWAAIFAREPELLARYDRIALIDDDIEADAETLNACFRIGAAQRLSLWQPSLSWESHATYAATLHNPSFALRYVNFVEMMTPFFSSAALGDVLPLFSAGLESGIDLVWCSLVQSEARRFAVIDAVQVTHTRPVGSRMADNGFISHGYGDDIALALAAFDMSWPSCVSDRAILANGALVESKTLIGALTLGLFGSIGRCPKTDVSYRLRSIADQVRRQFTRSPNYSATARSHLALAADFVRSRRSIGGGRKSELV